MVVLEPRSAAEITPCNRSHARGKERKAFLEKGQEGEREKERGHLIHSVDHLLLGMQPLHKNVVKNVASPVRLPRRIIHFHLQMVIRWRWVWG